MPGVAPVVDERAADDRAIAVLDRVEHVRIRQVRELPVAALDLVADLVELAGELLAVGDDDIEAAGREADAEDVGRLALARAQEVVQDKVREGAVCDEAQDRLLDDLALTSRADRDCRSPGRMMNVSSSADAAMSRSRRRVRSGAAGSSPRRSPRRRASFWMSLPRRTDQDVRDRAASFRTRRRRRRFRASRTLRDAGSICASVGPPDLR